MPELQVQRNAKANDGKRAVTIVDAVLDVECFDHQYARNMLLDATVRHPMARSIRDAANLPGAALRIAEQDKARRYPPSSGRYVTCCAVETYGRASDTTVHVLSRFASLAKEQMSQRGLAPVSRLKSWKTKLSWMLAQHMGKSVKGDAVHRGVGSILIGDTREIDDITSGAKGRAQQAQLASTRFGTQDLAQQINQVIDLAAQAAVMPKGAASNDEDDDDDAQDPGREERVAGELAAGCSPPSQPQLGYDMLREALEQARRVRLGAMDILAQERLVQRPEASSSASSLCREPGRSGR